MIADDRLDRRLPARRTPARRGYSELGYVFAGVGALLFSTKAIAIKLAYVEAVDAETLLALRMVVSLPVYIAIGAMAIADRRRRGAPLPSVALTIRVALVGALGYWFAAYADFSGLEYISAQFERLILFTYPLFMVLFGALFFGQPMSRRALAAIGVSYLGIALIFTEKVGNFGTHAIVGAGFVLAAALAFAFYQLIAKPLIGTVGPRLFTCVAMGGAAVGAFASFLVTHPIGDLVVSQRVFGLSVFLGLGATVLPSFFLNAALHRISAQANAILGTLSPVVTILLAVLILGEALTTTDLAGAALVLAGVGWFTLADLNDRRQASHQAPKAMESQGERRADAEIGPEADCHALAAGALDDDQVGDRTDQREIAGKGRGHGDDQPGPGGIGERADEWLQHENRGNIADKVRQDRRYGRQHRHTRDVDPADGRDHVRADDRLLKAGYDDEQAGEHDQQRPVDIEIDLLRLHPPGEEQHRAGEDGDPRHRLARRRTARP